jgi:hypothetical protein
MPSLEETPLGNVRISLNKHLLHFYQLTSLDPVIMTSFQLIYKVNTTRGRGRGAAEKRHGAVHMSTILLPLPPSIK